MARALYRTHRSRSLDEIIGQEHITDLLKRSLQSERISHAYLLTGPRGTGKTSVARILAHEINHIPYSDETNLDIIEIDAASNRRIDDIRDLREKVHIAPVHTKYKVYIIDEVHMLTAESFNALLKTLEEPPEHVVFILATTEVHKVPATILSRTQRFHFRLAPEKKVIDHLRSIADKESIVVDDAALALIARHGGGSFRDSVSLLDQLSSSGEPITTDLVELTLGLVPREQIASLKEAILSHHTNDIIDQLHIFDDSGISAVILSEQLVRELAETANEQPELFDLLDQLLEVSKARQPFIKLIAILVNYSLSHHPKVVATRTTTAAIVSSPQLPVKKAANKTPVISTETPAHVKPAADEIPSGTSPAVSNETGVFDWTAVLTAAKKHHAPLHSVLSRAKIDFDQDKLTLTFVYALHRKKLEQAQYRAQLVQLIKDVCQVAPEIVINDGKALSDEASAVAAIMGGGEPVHA